MKKKVKKDNPSSGKRAEVNLVDDRNSVFYRTYWGELIISADVIERLNDPEGWMNDETIHFCISRIIEDRNDFLLFPSYFYQSLYYIEKEFSYESSRHAVNFKNHQIDIFEKDVLIIPFCFSDHWSLVFVIRPLLMIQGSSDNHGNRGMMIFLDSLQPYHGRHMPVMREQILKFLWNEWESVERLGYTAFSEDTNYDSIGEFVLHNCAFCFSIITPKQQNNNDCGFFMIKYVETLLENWPQSTINVDQVVTQFGDLFSAVTQKYITEDGRHWVLSIINRYEEERKSSVNLVES